VQAWLQLQKMSNTRIMIPRERNAAEEAPGPRLCPPEAAALPLVLLGCSQAALGIQPLMGFDWNK